ncbi:MAG TPA: hypothetical protein VHR45_14080 [Thermoanaerobaculia bacterium]|nr:hypothetical protein [Thermoanaerobaculia bacterium]
MKANPVLSFVWLLFLLTFAGCAAGGDGGAPPAVPSQTPSPKLTEYSGEKAEFDNRLQDLNSLKGAIQQAYEEWDRLGKPAAAAEPVFSSQRSTKRDQILEKSDELEKKANEMLERPYLREHAGAGPMLRELVAFAGEMRHKVGISE